MSGETGRKNVVAIKLLVVDDEPDITRTLKKGLELLGTYSVDAFNDPVLALSKFDAGIYDMVILDIRMPKMNGFELCRKITQKDPQTKVCFMTAFEINPDEFRKMFPKLGVDCLVKKPVRLAELESLVLATLAKSG